MSTIDRRAIYERDQGLCGFCGELVPPDRFHVDHVTPRALGGSSDPSNLRVAHRKCNVAAAHLVRTERRRQGLPFLGRSDLRLPDELHERLVALAQRERRSLHAQILRLLEDALAETETTKP